MVVLSKLFNVGIKHRNCANDLFHPNACISNSPYNLYRQIISNSKYFAPIVFLPLLVKIRRINRNLLMNTIQYYIETVFCGVVTSITITSSMCIFRNLFGEFHLYLFVYLPTALGAISSIFASSPRVKRLYYTSMIQCSIESLLIRRKNILTRFWFDSVSVQTLVFMCCSSVIMQAKRTHTANGFWFLYPNKNITNTNKTDEEDSKDFIDTTDSEISTPQKTYCNHHAKDGCVPYLIDGVRNYVIAGLSLDLIRMLISKVPGGTKGFIDTALAKIRNYRISSATFLGTYIGIYRFAHCFLNSRSKLNEELNHSMAAFLGGFSYVLAPKLTIHCYAMVMAMEILWKKFELQPTEKKAFIFIKRMPIVKMLYVMSMAFLVHTYVFRRHYVSNLGAMIINGITDNTGRRISEKLALIEKSLSA